MAKKETKDEQPEVAEEKQEPIRVDAGIKKPKSATQVTSIGPVKINDPAENPRPIPSAHEEKLVEIYIDEELHINGQRLFGMVKVPIHQAQSIIPMLQSKKRADMEIFTGRNFLVKRMANNTLVIREMGTEDDK